MNEIALANFYRVLNNADRFPKEKELAEAAIAAKDELNALRQPSPPSSVQAEAVYDVAMLPRTPEQVAAVQLWLDSLKNIGAPAPIQAPGIVAELQKLVEKWRSWPKDDRQPYEHIAWNECADQLSSLIKAVGAEKD